MRKVFKVLAPFYLGASLSIFANVNCFQWEFWAIVAPFLLLQRASEDDE
jgi:uncharacterized membrane protein YoaK (UPF0700 family)